MGKASSSKKVARAAGASGGRTSRGRAPVLWYSSLAVILLAGVGLTAFSRQQRQDKLGSPSSQTPPRANQDHWHTAYGVYVCDKWADPVTNQEDANGIHTHGDGIVHVHPFTSKVAGKNATFGKFVTQVNAKIDTKSFTWPAGSEKITKKNGDKCGETAGEVKVFYDGKPVTTDPNNIRLTDRGKLVIAFVTPDTTAEKIGDPPSVPNLDSLTDVAPTDTSVPADPTASTVPGATTVPGAPGDTTPTTAPAASTPTSAPASPDTTAPATTVAGK
jgi:hypothetical protein